MQTSCDHPPNPGFSKARQTILCHFGILNHARIEIQGPFGSFGVLDLQLSRTERSISISHGGQGLEVFACTFICDLFPFLFTHSILPLYWCLVDDLTLPDYIIYEVSLKSLKLSFHS